ncbi:MAG TPA: CHASE2 domain-containing protein, partial [bacterium]|nr:CHASE2 domain-containing protein [bacterium]
MPIKTNLLFRKPLLLILAIPITLFLLHSFRGVDFRELEAVDLRFRLRGEQKANPELTIVEIDDASIAAIGQWPWPRSIHAVLLDVLSRFKPRSVFFDVLFTESSPDPVEDEKLSFAVKKLGNVILPFYYYSEKPFGAFYPIPALKEAAEGMGYVNVEPDPDGRIRRVRAFMQTEKGTFDHPAVLLKGFQQKDGSQRQSLFRNLPFDPNHYFWINYPGPLQSYDRIPFNQVIAAIGTEAESGLRELFENRIVIIGHTATGTTDLKATPFTSTDPGISVQAAAIHTIFSGKFLRELPAALHIFILFALTLLVWKGASILTPVKGLLLTAATALCYAVANFILFLLLGWILPLVVPLTAIVLTYIVTLFLKYLQERFEGELIRRELSTAARIQETFLPQSTPRIKHLDAAFTCRFAKQVGGDLYEWIDFGQGRLGVCIGDVSGKGVPAALYMAKAMSDFRGEDKTNLMPGKVCAVLNQALVRGGTSGMFLTFLYVLIDPAHKKLFFSNAGHEYLIFYRQASGQAEIVKSEQGRPLGLFEESDYQTASMDFREGDAFLLLSDGVKELRNSKGD